MLRTVSTFLILNMVSCTTPPLDRSSPSMHTHTEAETVPEVRDAHQALQAVKEQTTRQGERVAAVENYLSDKVLLKDGKAPIGWVQPDLQAYMDVDAPQSFIPATTLQLPP